MEKDKTIVELENAYVLYYNDRNSEYGEALAIDILDHPSDPNGHDNILNEWLIANGDERGTASIEVKTPKYTDKAYKPFYFKINNQTKIIDLDGKRVSKDELDRDVRVGLVARAVPYDNDYGTGIKRVLETIVVYEPKHKTQTNLARIKKMREEREKLEKESDSRETPQSANGSEAKVDNAKPDTSKTQDNKLNLDEVPF